MYVKIEIKYISMYFCKKKVCKDQYNGPEFYSSENTKFYFFVGHIGPFFY
jgi:hypothetical protein